jgi:lipoic acid synthetase
MPVDRYVEPAEFDMWRAEGEAAGFLYVASGPLVRSSYKAGEVFLEAFAKERANEIKAAKELGAGKAAAAANQHQAWPADQAL